MFFDQLTQRELTRLEGIGFVHQHAAGSTIIAEGSGGSSFSIILSGKAEVRKSLQGGHFKALVELGPLDLIGELGLLGAETRTASVVAITECEIMEFGKASFEKLVEEVPAIGAKVYRGMAEILAQRLASADESLMDTIIWALGSPSRRVGVEVSIASRPRLKMRAFGSSEGKS